MCKDIEQKMCNKSISLLQSNVIQLGGVVENSCLALGAENKPKWSTVPLFFILELSKSNDADGLLKGRGERLFFKSGDS